TPRPSTCTSSACGPRWRSTRRARSRSSPCAASATASNAPERAPRQVEAIAHASFGTAIWPPNDACAAALELGEGGFVGRLVAGGAEVRRGEGVDDLALLVDHKRR